MHELEQFTRSMVSDNKLSQERRAELESAFRGANSLLFLLVYLVFSVMPVVWLYSKMTGWMQVSGLVLLSLFTAFILMLFVSGIIKLILRRLFMMVSPEYRQLFEGQE
jgi:hypothetical protein